MNSYRRSIDKILSYIDANLSEKHELDKLAELAYLSKFHFHRIMKAHLDETLGNYINRIRLETAMKLLRYSEQPVKEIAYQIGYETVSAFSKSFRKMFGVSPTSIRKENDITIENANPVMKKKFQLHETIRKISDIPIIFQRSNGKTGDSTTVDNWESLFTKAQEHQVLNFQSKFYGINWDDPAITANEKVRYDACISIEPNSELSDAFSTKAISGGKYLCFLYKGDYQNLGLVYNQIFKECIIKMNYELREEPIFEQYINNKETTAKEDLLTEIFIPIK